MSLICLETFTVHLLGGEFLHRGVRYPIPDGLGVWMD